MKITGNQFFHSLIIINFLLIFGFSRISFASESELPISRIFKQNINRIVIVGAMDGRQSRLGTGFIITEDGAMATSYHLVSGAKRIFVRLHQKQVFDDVKVLAHDKKRDIAIIGVTAKNLASVFLGDSDQVQVGQRVVAIGNPLGLESTISDGLISSIRPFNGRSKIFQVSVPVSSGSSGGPLFNLQGDAIGLVAASNTKGQILNFAIPINEVKKLLVRIPKRYKRPAEGAASSNRVVGVDKGGKNSTAYIVKTGDTLYRLAKRFDTTVIAIMKLNQLKSSRIHVGQRIKIPLSFSTKQDF